jgi:hypothetical protein
MGRRERIGKRLSGRGREVDFDVAIVHIVDQNSTFGNMAKEAAIDPCFLQLEEEEVVLTLGEGNHRATIVLTEEKRIETDFAAGEDIEADRYGVFAKRQSATGDQSGKKASPTHGADRRDDLGLEEAA